jgi:hypothetical protein
MADAEVSRAAERVMLACRALAAAANDLRIAQAHTGMTAVDDAADLVGAETERVCELAEDLASLASNLGGLPALANPWRASD